MDTVRELRGEGISAVYGDASHRETLEAACVAKAGNLILTSAGMGNIQEVIRLARELNPEIHVLARTAHLRDLDALRRAGADNVFSGEGEVALCADRSDPSSARGDARAGRSGARACSLRAFWAYLKTTVSEPRDPQSSVA